MTYAALHHVTPPIPPAITPWALRAWPPLLWQAGGQLSVRFQHVGTRIIFHGDPSCPPAGQTIWAARADEGEAGMAWDWVQIARGVVAMADPMSVISNLRFIGGEGEVLTAYESSLFLNEIVRLLPWQSEVQRALHKCND